MLGLSWARCMRVLGGEGLVFVVKINAMLGCSAMVRYSRAIWSMNMTTPKGRKAVVRYMSYCLSPRGEYYH